MFDVCPKCGVFREDKTIDVDNSLAICPVCKHGHPFLQKPLFVLTGASGTGKSTLCLQLAQEPEIIALESDIFWRDEFITPEDNYKGFRNLCLKVAKNIQQNGKPVLLCGSATPSQFEECPQARYFSHIHYLALVCDNDEIERRLKARPAWRNTGSQEFIANMVAYNQWFKDNAKQSDYDLTLLDTTHLSLQATLEQVRSWYTARL